MNMTARLTRGKAPQPISLPRRRPLALAGQRARSFSFNFLFAGVASKNYGGHEEAKSHNASAKNDNEECNKECHLQILISFTRAKKICSGI